MAVHKKYNNGTKSNALGRGLDALISTESVRTQGSSTINEIALDQIEANPNQPRREFDDEALHELAESIKAIGIIQPITLRQVSENRFQIIAGERRWRASQLAGLLAIPAYIRTISDENVMEMALVENIQRQDLNAIEIALAYEHLLENEGMTQEKISERVGKSRAAIANYLRLLKLPAQVQMALQKKEIDMGHCRALLALDSPSLQIKLFKEIQKNGYSVRKVEEMVQKLKNGEDIESGKKTIASKAQVPEEFTLLKNRLSQFLNTEVQFTCSPKGKGKISIPFANEEELERIMSIFDQLKGLKKVKIKLSHICITALLWLSSTPMLAQKDSLSWDAPESISLEDSITLDSAKLSKALAPKALRKKRDWATWRPNTKRALWLALVLPGAGQIYNRKYWKLPIIYGGFVGCAYAMSWNNQMYHDYSQAYLDIMDDDPNTQSYNQFLHLGAKIDESNIERYKEIFRKRKDRFRRWRDMSMFVMIGVYALSVIDAYVDASLSEFDISDDLSLKFEPTMLNNESRARNPFRSSALGLQCSLTF